MSDRINGAGIFGNRGFWWFGVAVWGAVLFLLSANSHPPAGPQWPHQDKVLHALYFSGGAFCFLMALQRRTSRWSWPLLAMAGMIFGGVAGALDEWHQTFTPGRSGNDPGDWLADVTGGLAGAWIALRFLRWLATPRSD